MEELDPKQFHSMYGEQRARMSYERRDFVDYLLMMVITALAVGFAYGLRSPLTLVGVSLCAIMSGTFPIRHGMSFAMPLILRRPQDVLYMVIYRLQNLKPMYFIAIALLLLENELIYLTPSWPHHAELMRKIALALFYLHFVSISVYRTAILLSHLRWKGHVREFLLQTTWRNVVSRRSGITLEILHAYFTGLLAHLVLIAPWYIVITHVRFSVLVLPFALVWGFVIQHRFLKVLNRWFYRDHWLCHNSELEFIYLHGPHHDAIPSGLIGVSGNGHLEGFLRHTLGAPGPFYNPVITFMVYAFELMNDIKGHQYIPGVLPRVTREFQQINQHSTHHFGRFEPYSFGLKLDQPGISAELRNSVRFFPEELQNSVQLDERLTGFHWSTSRYQRYLDLFEKYTTPRQTSAPVQSRPCNQGEGHDN